MNNSLIKVIEFVPTLLPGGAETMIKDYCLLADKNRFDIQVVVVDHHYNTYNEKVLIDAGIKVTFLSELLFGADKVDISNPFMKAARKISRYYYWRQLVSREQPDIIHLHLHLSGFMKVLPLRRLNCGLVMTIHNTIDTYFSKNKSDGDKYREYCEVNRLIHSHNMSLLTLHRGLVDELKVFFDTKNVYRMNNGVVLDRFDPNLYDRGQIRSNLGYFSDDYVIGHVGSFTKQKNHQLILNIFSEIKKNKTNAKLLLIGDGKLKEEVLHEIDNKGLQDSVTVLSKRGDIPELMSAMDVFLFPSRWEGFGNVMIEAQSMGLKCVVSDKVPDCTHVTDNVIVCKLSDSVETWCDAILTDEAKRATKMSDIRDYDMRNCIRQLECVYKNIAERKPIID